MAGLENTGEALGGGLAATGKVPFVATFAAFLTRAYDFIRMAAISQSGTNIRKADLHTKDGSAFGTIFIEVDNLPHLDKVLKAVHNEPARAPSRYSTADGLASLSSKLAGCPTGKEKLRQ